MMMIIKKQQNIIRYNFLRKQCKTMVVRILISKFTKQVISIMLSFSSYLKIEKQFFFSYWNIVIVQYFLRIRKKLKFMLERHQEDGWHSSSDSSSDSEIDDLTYKSCNKQFGLGILASKEHSLQPDMISGWRPKLPSCPLPLTYPNVYTDSLMKQIQNDDRFSIAYLGTRYFNSVQVNQQYGYHWKYRDRYSLNIAIIKEAVTTIGKDEKNTIDSQSQNMESQFKFDSSFQSGNLQLAVRVKRNQYDCFLRSDTNTKGHTNWYYFSVENRNQLGQVKINICNMTKKRNLYSKGMKPYVYEQKDTKEQKIWSQDPCYDVVFVERLCRYGLDYKSYQLQFKYKFTKKNQKIFFAYAIPYTYSDLQNFIKGISTEYSSIVTCKKLTQSLGGLDLPLLMITNPNGEQCETVDKSNSSLYENQNKKAIILTGRIHPGQSNASYVIEGVIRQLLKDTYQANNLRNLFVFYIIPMLNPDGVVIGNFRTSYSGKDLNRQFGRLNKYIFPQITALHDLTIDLKRQFIKGVQFYMDFHGHSVKKGLFCYGPQHPPSKSYFFKARALAKIIQQQHQIFNYRNSIFTISQHKKTTGRAHMLWKMKIPMTFTFEVSNGLYQQKDKKIVLLNKKILLQAGEIVFKGFYRYIQLEMKLPRQPQTKTVSTKNVNIRRYINSSKSNRQIKSSKKSIQNKNIPLEKLDGDTLNFLRQRQIPKPLTNKNSSYTLSAKQIVEEKEAKELIDIFQEIKRQNRQNKTKEFTIDDVQGGSDSQGSSQDLSKQQANKLYKQIMSKNDTKNGYKKHDWRMKNVRIGARKKEQKQTVVLINQLTEKDKQKSTRLDELCRPNLLGANIPRPNRKGTSVEYEKIVLAQKHFTLNL